LQVPLVTQSQDADHLRLLSIFHYVVAGMFALFAMFPVIYLVIGIAIVTGVFDSGAEPPPPFLGWMFIIAAVFFMTCGLAMAICVALAGRRLARRTNYLYCLVIAGIECIFMPFGTVLGVFTIIVLMRPTVKEMFGVGSAD
jgi:hypothetical protein